MRPEAFEYVAVANTGGSFPLRSSQGSSASSSLLRLTLVSSLAVLIVLSQLWLAVQALTSPDIRSAILARPIAAFELGVALAFWIGLFYWPLSALFKRVTWRRDVEITAERVAVRDIRTLGGGVWTAPLASYTGIAHHVRTSLSGTRHELILVHPTSARSVLLMVAEHIADADVARMSRLLGLPHVPAGDLHRLRAGTDTAKIDVSLLVPAAA